MKSASTETFSVSVPPLYDRIQVAWESIRAEHHEDDGYISFVTMGLQELSYYDKYEGEDLLTRFRESCLEERGIVEVIADKTLPVAGLTADIRTTQSPDGYFYYFALLKINNEYGYTLIGDCDSKSKEYFEPVFDEIWQSLQYFGNPVEALKKQKDGIDAIFAKYKSPAQEEEEEQQPAVKEFEPFEVPADDKEYWQIGDHTFTLKGESECYISAGDGALYVKIEAQAPKKLKKIINDYEDGKVYLQFYFKGIYNAGIPIGKFRFEEEKETTWMSYVWKGGFDYMQSLTAEVTLKDGWMGIVGAFNEYPVKAAIKIPAAQLEWQKYRFLKVNELNTAPAEVVRHLWLTDPYPGLLEETLYPLKELENLSIVFLKDNKQAAEFKEIPKALKRFKQLKELTLSGVTALDSLPQWLGDLKKLETFRLSDSQVEGIHPYIFQLPELKSLYLSGNKLSAIHQALPQKLENLVISDNQFTTVPDSVSQLKYLNIENNPLVKLPASVMRIKKLNLELEKKMALLDFSYEGAEPYDDDVFFAKHDEELLSTLKKEIKSAGLGKFNKKIIDRSRKSVFLKTTEEDTYTEKGNHRFGGLPDLPVNTSYPSFKDYEGNERGLQFIAQINCAEISHLQDYMPRTGILYFFIEDQEDTAPKVVYYDGNDLQSAKDLNIDPDYIYDQHGIYTPFRAESGKYASIPPTYNAGQLYPELANMEEMYDETEKLDNSLTPKDVHGINSYVFKQHDSPEIEAADAKKGKPEEWMVLLRVSSDNNPGFNFWDAGEIYFVIHKSDLKKKVFSNVYCGLESS